MSGRRRRRRHHEAGDAKRGKGEVMPEFSCGHKSGGTACCIECHPEMFQGVGSTAKPARPDLYMSHTGVSGCPSCAFLAARVKELEEVNANLRNVVTGDEEQLKRVVDQNAALRDRLVDEHQERELEVQALQSRLSAMEKVVRDLLLWSERVTGFHEAPTQVAARTALKEVGK